MRTSEYSDQHLMNAIGYHERKAEELRDELASRGLAATAVDNHERHLAAHRSWDEAGRVSLDTSMLEHRMKTLEGRIASAERKLRLAPAPKKRVAPKKRPAKKGRR